jgi:hypothetical protein
MTCISISGPVVLQHELRAGREGIGIVKHLTQSKFCRLSDYQKLRVAFPGVVVHIPGLYTDAYAPGFQILSW